MINCFQQECFIGILLNGSIIKLNDFPDTSEPPSLKAVKDCITPFRIFVTVQPFGVHCLVLNDYNELSIVEMETARYVATLSVENIVCMKSHPSVPVAVLGTNNGWIKFLCTIAPDQPKWIGEFFLSEYGISKLEFCQDGAVLVVFDFFNDWFVLKVTIYICDNELSLPYQCFIKHPVFYLTDCARCANRNYSS